MSILFENLSPAPSDRSLSPPAKEVLMGETPLSRRTFLSAAAITGLSEPLLSACGTSGPADSKGGGKTVQAWVLSDQAQNRVQNLAISDFNKGSSGKV